ncbi:acyltransferase family protein [Paraglaciecola arctica]|uniref:Heparan-alpha-glucosaminide N-acetyltransferase n=1 Tax=Paraglaciecola arctica BSs20135 TaxID=493475 RepID=K6Y4R3_9ALTE|nr:heparan-alpha-glucosaminide N-acetyltransferase domain-containing protein [Paraglaciecola arctica]GAC18936.1 heparan-alpha-glucosaminide N-acetyltransferase [Paraglaciecola arctica BSs20135]
MNQSIQTRIEAIDVLRGLALALMLLVNNPGSWSAVYAPFLHADWHGLTPTDLVFPFFLFVMGASMACSLRGQIQASGLPWLSIFKRSFLLVFIGFLLQIIPFDQAPDTWRIMGVLQRIGLCFLLVASMLAIIKERWLLLSAVVTLIVYWLLLLSAGQAPYSLENNSVRHFDMAILGSAHMWQGKGLPFDPEGLLSTIGAAMTVLSGYLICVNVLQQKNQKQQILQLMIVGAILLALGFVWSVWHPINKSLWTSSYVLVSSAFACLSLAVIILLWRVPVVNTVLNGLKIYGSNPIFIYVAAWVFAIFLNRFSITIGTQSNSIQVWIYSSLQSLMTDKLASLLYAIVFTALFYGIALVLYKKRIFIKL